MHRLLLIVVVGASAGLLSEQAAEASTYKYVNVYLDTSSILSNSTVPIGIDLRLGNHITFGPQAGYLIAGNGAFMVGGSVKIHLAQALETSLLIDAGYRRYLSGDQSGGSARAMVAYIWYPEGQSFNISFGFGVTRGFDDVEVAGVTLASRAQTDFLWSSTLGFAF